MNYTVIPKSIVNFQTGNSKPIDIYVWATIKYCSNHKTNISHITEEKLSLLTELDERTIRRSIKRLKDAGYLTVHTTIKEDADRGFIKRNSYYIKPANKDYFFLDNSFFKRNYPAKIARRRRNHGFHLNRRTAAGRPRIRRSPHLDLRRDERHGDHGPQPDPARIKHATRLYINVPLRKHSTPNPLREKDAGKGRIINAATSLRINVPSDSTLQPSNKGPRKIYLNQYTALRSESDRQCSDVSRALPRKKFRVNPASNNGPQNCGYRRIQKKRSHIIP